jgi:hypothetical protein
MISIQSGTGTPELYRQIMLILKLILVIIYNHREALSHGQPLQEMFTLSPLEI